MQHLRPLSKEKVPALAQISLLEKQALYSFVEETVSASIVLVNAIGGTKDGAA